MLKKARVANSPSATRLTELWAARYLPDLSLLPDRKGEFPIAQLVETASTGGRAKTVQKMRRLLRLNCEMAGLEAGSLYAYIPNIVNLAEARRLAEYVERVYDKTFAIYQAQQPPSPYLRYIDASSSMFSKLAMETLLLPVVSQLASELESEILHLQDQHVASQDARAVGFITTQLHFCTREMLRQMSECEQVLLSPYLRFVEEQVCIPWQRLCAAAADYRPGAPELALVEALLPQSHAIARSVHQQSLQRFAHHRSRRGSLNDGGVAASTLRDLNMFQGYLWLCVLEQRMTAIEHELLPLCIAVFPSIDVQWNLVEAMLHLLVSEIQARVPKQHQSLLRPHTDAMQRLFSVPHLRAG